MILGREKIGRTASGIDYTKVCKTVLKMRKKILRGILLPVLLTGAVILLVVGSPSKGEGDVHRKERATSKEKKEQKEPEHAPQMTGYTVVLDAGHGGVDGGKLSVDGSTLEKDVNLQIVLFLQEELKKLGVNCVLTRSGDYGLYSEQDSNRKVADMRNRVKLMEEAGADVIVSIHQNSYHEEKIHGAQVFYYEGSTQGQELAERIQEALRREVDPQNERSCKANSSYYILKKTTVPTVIVECGFLSNYKESSVLILEDYQKLLAETIAQAVYDYLKENA